MDGTAMKKGEIREPAVAGSFYTSDPKALEREIKQYLDAVPSEKIQGEVVALIAPHAGYIYSGQVAAYAYKLLKENSFDKVVVIAPSHHVYFRGASVYATGAFRTPLGIIPIDEEIARKLMKEDPSISFMPQAHAEEHSLEVQLPFLQTVLKDFKLVPIVMGDQGFKNCQVLSDALYRVIKGKKILIVASSDLSHFHPYVEAVRLDSMVTDRIRKFDAPGLAQDISKGSCEACGGGPIVTVMLLAGKIGADKAKVLKYANSGDVTGDRNRIVGYAAAVLYKEGKGETVKGVAPRKAGIDLGLTDEEKRLLHQVAKTSIEARLRGEALPHFEPDTPTLKEKRGAFVSLHRQGELRGCIGYIQAYKPLYQTVQEMAVAAAFQDTRFIPLRKEELKDLEIEISVLTPLRKITDPKEIQVGKHGIYIMKGFSSGLLLPQVATDYKWDVMTFLENTCRKAGLPDDAWKEKDAEIYIFSADIF